jgi:single-stranded DNA-binding protein
MEFLNKIEVIGIIGQCNCQTINGNTLARMSVVTECVCTDKENNPVIDPTWHSIRIWQKDTNVELDTLKKSDAVHVIGRLRPQRYNTASGEEKIFYEIIAHQLELLKDEDKPLTFQNEK